MSWPGSGASVAHCGEALFYEFLKLLGKKAEICFEHLFVDGAKIEANANKYSFVWKKSTATYEARLLSKLDAMHEQMCQ